MYNLSTYKRGKTRLDESTVIETTTDIANIDVALSTIASEATLVTKASETTLVKVLPISKGQVFNTGVTANTDILSELSPTNTPTIFRIYACFSAIGVLTVRRRVSATTISENINNGNELNANASYMFDIIVNSSEFINLRYSVTTTALKLAVIEVGVA